MAAEDLVLRVIGRMGGNYPDMYKHPGVGKKGVFFHDVTQCVVIPTLSRNPILWFSTAVIYLHTDHTNAMDPWNLTPFYCVSLPPKLYHTQREKLSKC